MLTNISYHNYDHNGYLVLRLGYAEAVLLGRWDGLSNALYSLHKDRTLWVHYNLNSTIDTIETYLILAGRVEMGYEGIRRELEVGELINASLFNKTILFHALTDVEILIKNTAKVFEPGFFETQILQKEADAIEKLDGYTYMHCNRIKDYSIKVWTELDLPKENLLTLRWGAYFHDIGKRSVPQEILNKPGSLTPEEWSIMKAHTTEGAKIMLNHRVEKLRKAAFIVEQHHERYDGKGYPHGLKGDEISREASIVAVVDAFDAMTTDRVYKKAMPIEEAMQELISGKGTQFNPNVVDVFLSILRKNEGKWK
ncbi:HD-GYP domain-containing protein [Sporosarcina sp. CAU 1771]